MSTVETIIKARHSTRAFTSQPVAQDTLERLLRLASLAPSGSNTQPWRLYVAAGKVRDKISETVLKAYDEAIATGAVTNVYPDPENYYPKPWFSPYIDRRREQGRGFYGLLKITREDRAKMIAQEKQNFTLFGAPVAIFVTLDKKLGDGSKIDLGLIMENIVLLAEEAGLATCIQAAWNRYEKLVLPELKAEPTQRLMSTIALGYEDPAAEINEFRTTRVPVSEFATFLGFPK